LLVQIGNNLGLGILDFLEGAIAFLLNISEILLGLKLPVQLVLYLLYLASMQFLKFLPGMVQLRLTGVSSLFELSGMLQLELNQLLL
jgi:uncharacterized membrane protein